MRILIPQILLRHSLEHPRRLRPPPKHLRTKPQPIRLHRLLGHHSLVLPQLFEIRITRPRRVRQEVSKLLHILEARLKHPVLQFVVDVELAADRPTCLDERGEVLIDRGLGGDGAIVAPGPEAAFLGFEVASWFYVGEDFAEEGWPVGYAAGGGWLVVGLGWEDWCLPREEAGVDEIEAVGLVKPFGFEVFDDEFDVRDDPVWLDGAEVVADYFCGWIFPGLG